MCHENNTYILTCLSIQELHEINTLTGGGRQHGQTHVSHHYMYRLQEQHGVAADMKLQTWADMSKNVSRHLLDVVYSDHCSPDSNN